MRQYLLDSAPLAGYLHGRAPFVNLITPFILEHKAATSILVYAEVIEYLKGLPDFPQRKHQLHILLREIYPYFGSPGIPMVTRQISLPRQAKPLEIFGRPLNDVLFSREFRESPHRLAHFPANR